MEGAVAIPFPGSSIFPKEHMGFGWGQGANGSIICMTRRCAVAPSKPPRLAWGRGSLGPAGSGGGSASSVPEFRFGL